jgi:hypothetical protein
MITRMRKSSFITLQNLIKNKSFSYSLLFMFKKAQLTQKNWLKIRKIENRLKWMKVYVPIGILSKLTP